MKREIKRWIRNYCPDIPFIRNRITAVKLKEYLKYVMDPEDVTAVETGRKDKKEIVSQYRKKWLDCTALIVRKLEAYLEHNTRLKLETDLDALKTDVLFAYFAYGFMPDEYFVYGLKDKTPQERKTYISDRDRYLFVYQMNDIIDMDIFLDKYRTYEKFKKYYKREAVCAEKKADYDKFTTFVEKHPVFVQKNVALSRGESVKLVDIRKYKKTVKEYFTELIVEGRHIIEECVIQSDIMRTLNSSSVNTVRCITFMTERGIEIGPCFLKVGQGNSFVDNGGSGGILVGIDNQNGILNTVGFDEFLTEYQEHPDTNIQFKGYRLPEWDKLCALAKEMSGKVPNVRYIGWDMAHTENGWVVIEGNSSSQFIGPQIVWEKGIKQEIDVQIGHDGFRW